MRELTSGDEPALQALLWRVYGPSYSYRTLYLPRGVAALIDAGTVSLWGDFAEDGALVSHTGFLFKDPRRDYVESGMSMRDPARRPQTPDALVWRRLLAWAEGRFAFIHQNTTTYHPLAQRYAERYLRARPAGIIVGYAVGEQLRPLTHPDGPMHALMMSTPLRGAAAARPVVVPDGPWGAYLAMIALGLGLATASPPVGAAPSALAVELIERNDALDLTRRVVVRGPDSVTGTLAPAGARTDLLHLPLDERLAGLDALVEAGYVPVGLRPHLTRPHELVLQYLPGECRRAALDEVRAARLAPASAAVVEQWRAACARTS